MPRHFAVAVLAITLAGVVLRVAGIDESLFGDELFTYHEAEPDGPGEVFDRMQEFESNPPLITYLAWLAGKVGDATISIRVPSLLAGTALIPLVAVLGRRLGGAWVGITAAALVALSPFAVFFATEARAYGLLMLLTATSTLALLSALEGRSRGWWALFAVTSAAALYTHYTAVFPLAVQAAWALWAHRERVREILLAHAAVAVLFAPWLPQVQENDAERAVGGSFDLTPGTALTAPLRSAFGHPHEAFTDLPAGGGIALLALALLAAAAGFALARGRLPALAGRREPLLLVALIVATPAGLLLYDALGGGDLFAPRNMSASVPALVIALAWLAWSLPRPAALAATGLMLLAAGVGSIKLALDDDHARPAHRAIAHTIDDRARPGDTVVSSPLFFVDPESPLHRGLEIQFDEDHAVYRAEGAETEAGLPRGVADPRAWAVAPGGRVYVAGYEQAGTFLLPAPPRRAGTFREVSRRTYRGLTPLTLVVYERAAG